jgi:four helix bundle protein
MAGDLADLIVYREASELAAAIVRVSARIRGIARANAAAQMVRAAESVPANLVEGVGRSVSRDCVRFLTIARSSARELEHHLRQARLARRIPEAEADGLVGHTRRVRFLLRRLQESVERRLPP